MATLMQSRIEALNQEPLDSESVVRAFQPWRQRLSVQQLLRWTTRGIAVGLLLACIVLLIARLMPWASALAWATGCALISRRRVGGPVSIDELARRRAVFRGHNSRGPKAHQARNRQTLRQRFSKQL